MNCVNPSESDMEIHGIYVNPRQIHRKLRPSRPRALPLSDCCVVFLSGGHISQFFGFFSRFLLGSNFLQRSEITEITINNVQFDPSLISDII